MQTASAPVTFTTLTTTRKVSGGEIAAQTRIDGRTVFWMNGHRIDRATARRKAGM